MRAVPPQRVTRRLYLLTSLLCGAFGAFAQGPAPSVTGVAKVTVATPKNGAIAQTVKLPGSLIPDGQVAIFAKVTGYLDEITVDRGGAVSKNQVIAKLSAPEMQSELALAEAKLRAARARIGKAAANAELAKTNYERLTRLHSMEPGAVTEEDVDDAAAKSKVAQAEVASVDAEVGVASADVKRLKTMIDYLTVRAPFDGTITERYLDPGAFITAGASAKPIVELTSVSKLRLAFDLPERLTPFVKPGQRVTYGLAALPGKTFDATISRRSDALAPDTRTMRAEVDVDNTDGAFSPGMYASVQIPLEGVLGISVIPSSALRTIDGQVCVLAVIDGKSKKLRVESLADAGTEAVVSGELTSDTQMVVQGPATLSDGQPVEVKQGN